MRSTLRGLALAAIAAGLVIVTPPSAHAQRVDMHRIKSGDTLALLAGEIYGNRRYAILIMAANNLKHDAELRTGRRLKIPVNHEITTNDGDTIASLAEQHLEDPRRQKFLAEFNNISPGASLPVGMAIRVPLVVPHTAAGRERLGAIAAAYFAGDKSGKAKLIREYNFLASNTLEAGQTIWIPIDNVEVRQSRRPKPDADSRARAEKRKEMQKLAQKALSRAENAWYEGNYDAVKGLLTTIETAYLDTEDAVAIDVLLGRSYVAFGDTDTALSRFRKALGRSAGHTLDPYYYSPKVLDVWVEAGGQVSQNN